MSLHPECPYRPNDPYHLDKGSERRISSSESNVFDDIELHTKDPQTEIIALASQEILNKPEDIDSILEALKETFESHLGDRKSIKGHDYDTALKKAERAAVWAPYWHTLASIVAERTLPAVLGEASLVQEFSSDDYPWEEVDRNDEFLQPLTLDNVDKLYMHTLRSLLIDADKELSERITSSDDPYSTLQPLIPHLDRTYGALTGKTAAEGLYATYTGSAGSVALREFRAARASQGINENPYASIQFSRQRAQLRFRASFSILPLRIEDIDQDTLILDSQGIPQHNPGHYRTLALGHRGGCPAQFPLISPFERDRQLLDELYAAAITLGAEGEGITEYRSPGSGELTTIFAIADAQTRKELLTGAIP